MRKTSFLGLFILFFSLNLFAQTISKEEYKIYGVVLNEIAKGDLQFSFVILNKTTIIDSTITPNTMIEKDFAEKNKKSLTLSPVFSIKNQYWLVEKEEINQVLKIGDADWAKIEEERKRKNLAPYLDYDYSVLWKYFHKKYPQSGGYYQLSRIGFSPNKRLAKIEVEQNDSVSGYTKWFTLTKHKDKWRIIKFSSSEWIV